MSTATSTPISTGNWKIDRVHSHVGFAVKHMVVSTFRGSFDEYDGHLAIGDEPISALAARNGFADQSHCTSSFRQRFGATPAVYRRTFRGAG